MQIRIKSSVALGVYVAVSPSLGCLLWHVPQQHKKKTPSDMEILKQSILLSQQNVLK